MAVPALAGVTQSASASDTIALQCSVVDPNLCITTHGVNTKTTLEGGAGGTLIDYQPATGTNEFKLRVFNSVNCLTTRNGDNALVPAQCIAGDGDQKFHKVVLSGRTDWDQCGTQCIYISNFDPPASGKNIWVLPDNNQLDKGWVNSFS
jgi:hypothetical protein